MKKRHYFFIFLAIIASPIIVDFILYRNNPISEWLPTVGYPNEWIGFWGSFIGAIISGLIALYVLYHTITENAKIRETQVKTIKYTQQQTWLDNLRQQVISNYNMLDMQNLSTALYKLQKGEFEEARMSLMTLNRNIEFQANSSSLYFLRDELSREEQEYNDCLKRIMIEFGCLVNDSIFFASILPDLTKKPEPNVFTASPNDSIVSWAKDSYKAIISSTIFDTDTKNYYSKESILLKVKDLDPRDKEFSLKINQIFIEHYRKFSIVHEKKHELITYTEKVLRYEERRINKILE